MDAAGFISSSRRRRPAIKRLSGPDVAKQLDRLTRHKLLRRFDVHGALTQLDTSDVNDKNALLYQLANGADVRKDGTRVTLTKPDESRLRRLTRWLGGVVSGAGRFLRDTALVAY